MKIRNFGIIVAAAVVTSMSACKEQKRIDMAQVSELEKGIPKIIPSVATIHTIQKDDYSMVKIIIGDPAFYNAPEDKRKADAVKIGQLVISVTGADNCLTKGVLVVTKDTRSDTEMPADAMELDMKIDSLNKAAGK